MYIFRVSYIYRYIYIYLFSCSLGGIVGLGFGVSEGGPGRGREWGRGWHASGLGGCATSKEGPPRTEAWAFRLCTGLCDTELESVEEWTVPIVQSEAQPTECPPKGESATHFSDSDAETWASARRGATSEAGIRGTPAR